MMSPYKQQQTSETTMSDDAANTGGAGAATIAPAEATTTTTTTGEYSDNNNNNNNNSSLTQSEATNNIVSKKFLLNDNNSNHSHNQHYLRNSSSIKMGNAVVKHAVSATTTTTTSASQSVSVSTSGFNSYSSTSRKAPAASLPSTSASNHHHHYQPAGASSSASQSSPSTSSTPTPATHNNNHNSSSTANHRYSNGPMMTTIPANVPEVREYLFKLLMIGELGTGKTSFIKRYVHQYFSQHYRATIGVDFALKVLNWDENSLIRLQLWDIAGQERFGNMTRVYYKEAVGAFLAFDVNAPQTFQAVLKWKHDLDNKVCLADGNPIPCLLLANKCDAQKEQMDPQMLDKFALENGFCGWFYTSAKDNINIEQAAKFLVGKILQRQKHFVMKDNDDNRDIISLNYSTHSNTKSARKCGC